MARTWKHILRHDHFRSKYRYVGVFFERRFQPLSVGRFFSNQRESISRCPKSPFPSKTQNRQIARTSPLTTLVSKVLETMVKLLRFCQIKNCSACFNSDSELGTLSQIVSLQLSKTGSKLATRNSTQPPSSLTCQRHSKVSTFSWPALQCHVWNTRTELAWFKSCCLTLFFHDHFLQMSINLLCSHFFSKMNGVWKPLQVILH